MSNAAGGERVRVDGEQGLVLHTYPFRETSLIVEAFTGQHGRVGLIAKGARRPRSALRGTLLAFQPLTLAWSGKGELKTLHSAEWRGAPLQVRGRALLCGFYLNELLIKLLQRDAPHEGLFEAYLTALGQLADGTRVEAVLRSFEMALLRELGYALPLDRDSRSGEAIAEQARYVYVVEQGPVRVNGSPQENRLELQGRTLLDMQRGVFDDALTLQQSKQLMRVLINHYLGDQVLHTRQLLRDLAAF
jgi:DNA repair protein RecO (recombination protein O)